MTIEEILEFERSAPVGGRARDRAIRARFGVSSLRYHAALVKALEDPHILAHDATLVARLTHQRDERRRLRTAERTRRAAKGVDRRQGRLGEP